MLASACKYLEKKIVSWAFYLVISFILLKVCENSFHYRLYKILTGIRVNGNNVKLAGSELAELMYLYVCSTSSYEHTEWTERS